MKTGILAAIIALLPTLAFSQLNQQEKETPYIEVVGTGEMEIVPDQIFVTFTLKERFEGKKKIELEDQEKEMKKRMVKIGIDLNDLQLADAAADYVKIKRKKSDAIASKDYLLKVSTTTQVSQVFDLLDEIDAFNANIQRVDHSKIADYKKEVKMLAVKAAKEKAGYLLEAIGEKVGKPLFIQERETYDEPQFMMAKANLRLMDASGAQENEEVLPELAFKKIKLKYTVFARFAIQ